MKNKLTKLFYRWAYLNSKGVIKKEDTYFYRFSEEIGQSNLRMIRSMSIFMIVISFFVIASTFTYYVEESLRNIYVFIIVLEIILVVFIQHLHRHTLSSKSAFIITSFHLFHMLLLGSYIGVVYCREETALIFIVILTISSMIYTLPSMHTMAISTISTIIMLIASYYYKDSYWFESDALNSIAVLIFSILFGWRVNQIRAEEAFARSDVLRLNKELKMMSLTDPLTNLNNHRSFQDHYYEMFRSACNQHSEIGIIMMDLDKFKSFNDHYGHVAGDVCLSSVGAAIASAVPKKAIVCRYGGEEFIVLLDEKLCSEIATIGETIRKSVEDLKIPHIYSTSSSTVVTLSLGAYVGKPVNTDQPMQFIKQADIALYQSKEKGRNCLSIKIDKGTTLDPLVDYTK